MEFLHGKYKSVCRYIGIYAARSALSSVAVIMGYDKLYSHPVISRYGKGIFKDMHYYQHTQTFGTLTNF